LTYQANKLMKRVKMSKTVTVQAVAAAIRTTDGVTVSKRYTHKGSRNIRSCGVYTEKRFNGEIELDYWTSGYQHHADRKQAELNAVIATLTEKGFAVIEKTEQVWPIGSSRKILIVVAA
jgi:hypothetical protein